MFHHSILSPNQDLSGDGTLVFEMGVNPISFLLLRLKPLNETGTLANFANYLTIVGALDNVSVSWNGASVVNASGRDLAALNYFRHGIMPLEANPDDANNEQRHVVLPVMFGRMPYEKASCIPKSRRGEVVLSLTLDDADTGYDATNLEIDQVELLNANPTEFERVTTFSQTFGSTGDNDVDLPVKNLVRGLLCFGTTDFTGASPAPTLGRMRTLVDNQEMGFSSIDFETAHMMGSLLGRQPPAYDAHNHVENTAAMYAQNATTGAGPASVGSSGGWENYGWLDFDPTRDDEFSLDLRRSSRFTLRSNAEAAEAVRILPIEAVKIRDFLQGF